MFADGFTLEAAEEVCDGPPLERSQVLDLLGLLVDKSLVMATEETGGAVRNQMLETLRQYAASKLADSGEVTKIRRRHAQFFGDLVRSQRDDLGTSHEATQILLAEQDNIRAALRSSIDADDLVTAAAIVSDFWRFWYIRGLGREGREWTQEILDHEPDLGDEELAGLLHAAGSLAAWGDEAGRRLLEQELQPRRNLADPESLANVLNNLSVIAGITGDLEKEREYLQESLELESEPRRALTNLGWNAVRRDQLDEAESYFRRSLENARGGDERGWPLAGLALSYWLRGDNENSLALASEAVANAEEVGSVVGAAVFKVARAQALGSLDRTEEARAMLTESQAVLAEGQQVEFYDFWLITAAHSQTDPASTIRTLAAAQGSLDRFGFSLDKASERLMRVLLDEARPELDETDFETAWQEGYQQSFEEASALALEAFG